MSIETYGYSDMRWEVTHLHSALQDAIAADQAEGRAHLDSLGLGFAEPVAKFLTGANGLVESAQAVMRSIDSLCDGELRKYAPVPAAVESDAKRWRELAQKSNQKIAECSDQKIIDSWTGDAKNEYVAAVTVQENALEQLKDVMDGAAEGCDVGAYTNRSVFYALGKGAIEAKRTVGNGGGSGSVYYARTARAIPALEYLLDMLRGAANGKMTNGAADPLGKAANDLRPTPTVCGGTEWPTGIRGAGSSSAGSGGGSTAGATPDADAQIQQCLAGVEQ